MNIAFVTEEYVAVQNSRSSVDSNALNLIGSGIVSALCQCSYSYEEYGHVFYYNTAFMTPLSKMHQHFSFKNALDILYSVSVIIETRLNCAISFDNILLDMNYMFLYGDDVKFIYEPIVNGCSLTAKKFVLKLLSAVQINDERIERAKREIKTLKNDVEILWYIQGYLNSFAYSYRRKEKTKNGEV